MIWATVLIAGLLVVGGALQVHLSRALWKAIHRDLRTARRPQNPRQVLLRSVSVALVFAVLLVAFLLGAHRSVRAGAFFAVVTYVVMGLAFVVGLLVVAFRRTAKDLVTTTSLPPKDRGRPSP